MSREHRDLQSGGDDRGGQVAVDLAIRQQRVSGSPRQRIADAVLENFIDPRRFTNAFVDKAAARKLSGQSWRRAFWDGAVRGATGAVPPPAGRGPAHVNPLAKDLLSPLRLQVRS